MSSGNRNELKARMDSALEDDCHIDEVSGYELLEIILQARCLISRLEFEIEHGFPYEGSGQQRTDQRIIKCFDETAGEP